MSSFDEKVEMGRLSRLTKEASEMFAKKIEERKQINDSLNNLNEKAKYLEVDDEKNKRIQEVRKYFSIMYNFIERNCKSSRETSLVYTKLEEAQFWAIKGITREED